MVKIIMQLISQIRCDQKNLIEANHQCQKQQIAALQHSDITRLALTKQDNLRHVISTKLSHRVEDVRMRLMSFCEADTLARVAQQMATAAQAPARKIFSQIRMIQKVILFKYSNVINMTTTILRIVYLNKQQKNSKRDEKKFKMTLNAEEFFKNGRCMNTRKDLSSHQEHKHP